MGRECEALETVAPLQGVAFPRRGNGKGGNLIRSVPQTSKLAYTYRGVFPPTCDSGAFAYTLNVYVYCDVFRVRPLASQSTAQIFPKN